MLTDDRINELSREMVKGRKSVNWLAYTIAAEIREYDAALIRRMLEALEQADYNHEGVTAAIAAARARLAPPTA